jgi:hypothetical protein
MFMNSPRVSTVDTRASALFGVEVQGGDHREIVSSPRHDDLFDQICRERDVFERDGCPLAFMFAEPDHDLAVDPVNLSLKHWRHDAVQALLCQQQSLSHQILNRVIAITRGINTRSVRNAKLIFNLNSRIVILHHWWSLSLSLALWCRLVGCPPWTPVDYFFSKSRRMRRSSMISRMFDRMNHPSMNITNKNETRLQKSIAETPLVCVQDDGCPPWTPMMVLIVGQ